MTDNAWIETSITAVEVKENDPICFNVNAGDDAADAFWFDPSIKSDKCGGHFRILKSFCKDIGANCN